MVPTEEFAKRYGPWAVVAGASNGTGEAWARAVAARGVNVVLLSRRQAALDDVADADLRALVITGSGRAFSAGDDLLGMGGSNPAEDIRQGHHRMIRRLRALRAPVVAALNGFTLGAGLDLALACDFRFGDKTTRMGIPAARLGIVYGTLDCSLLLRQVGLANAKRVLFSGQAFDVAQDKRGAQPWWQLRDGNLERFLRLGAQ